VELAEVLRQACFARFELFTAEELEISLGRNTQTV